MDTRISWDTSLSELMHSDENLAYIDLDEGELMHWKYIKREKQPNGKWRYYYDKEEMKNDTKNFFNGLKDKAKSFFDKKTDEAVSTANKAASGINNLVDAAKGALGKFYDDANNIYDVTRASYSKKLNEIKNTKEWQDIVTKQDSEYVKKNSDGTTTYLIDDYLVDKKHPVLDAIGDIMAGREVSVHEITKDSVVAGLKDYATTGLELGMMGIGFLSNGLQNKFKLSQGSYDDTINALESTINTGANYLENITTAPRVEPESVSQLANMIATASNASKSVNEGDIVEAATILMQSDKLKEAVGSTELYKQAESVLTGLSEEEIMLINLLLQQMRR